MKRNIFLSLWVLFLLIGIRSATAAQTVNGLKHLTIYDAGVAEFLEERTIELQPGLNTIEWRSLMPKAYTGTIRVTAEGAEIVRQNITYDGNEVRNEKSPVLHLVLDNKAAAGARHVQVDYLAPGIRWQANYSLLLESAGKDTPPKSGSLDAWVTVFNNTGTDISAATVDLIAGEISLFADNDSDNNQRAVYQNVAQLSNYRGDSSGDSSTLATAEVSSLSVFSRLRLGNNITMKANALVNRLPLFQRARLAIVQRNVFEHAHNEQTLARGGFMLQPQGLQARLVSRNNTGFAMPGGRVTLYSRENELAQITGQDRITITPNGADFAVSPGRSSTLLGTRRIVSRKNVTCREDEKCTSNSKLVTSVEIVLTNRGTVEAEAFVREGIEPYDSSEWKITQSTFPGERLGDHSIQFRLMVPAGGSTRLNYTVETK